MKYNLCYLQEDRPRDTQSPPRKSPIKSDAEETMESRASSSSSSESESGQSLACAIEMPYMCAIDGITVHHFQMERTVRQKEMMELSMGNREEVQDGQSLVLRSPLGHCGICVSFELAAAATDGNAEEQACCRSSLLVPSGYLRKQRH